MHSRHLDLCQCRACVLYSCFFSKETWKRDPVAGEQSTCSSEGEDPPGDPETLEAKVTPVSTLYLQAMRALKVCSIYVSPAANPPHVFCDVCIHFCESSRVQSRKCTFTWVVLCERAESCASCPSKCTNVEKMASGFSSIVLPERVPTFSRSREETSGKTN